MLPESVGLLTVVPPSPKLTPPPDPKLAVEMGLLSSIKVPIKVWSLSDTTTVLLSAVAIVVVPVLLVLLTALVNVLRVDWTLPLPFNSKDVLELFVIGDPEELSIVLPFVSRIIFLYSFLD